VDHTSLMRELHLSSNDVFFKRYRQTGLFVTFTKRAFLKRFAGFYAARRRSICAQWIHRFPDDYDLPIDDDEQRDIVGATVLLASRDHIKLALGHLVGESKNFGHAVFLFESENGFFGDVHE